MDLNFTPAELAFRDEVRTFLREQLPADLARRVKSGLVVRAEDYTHWQGILHRNSLAGCIHHAQEELPVRLRVRGG